MCLFSKSLKKPKGRLEMSSSPKTSELTSEYEIITTLDVKAPAKPIENCHKSPKLVKCLKKLVKNMTSRPKPKHKLRRCESSVDVIRSHATQFRFWSINICVFSPLSVPALSNLFIRFWFVNKNYSIITLHVNIDSVSENKWSFIAILNL